MTLDTIYLIVQVQYCICNPYLKSIFFQITTVFPAMTSIGPPVSNSTVVVNATLAEANVRKQHILFKYNCNLGLVQH